MDGQPEAVEQDIDLSLAFYNWPYFSLLIAIFISLLLLLPHIGKAVGFRPSPELLNLWLFWRLLPVYMFHQFEEHGIDTYGNKYAFQPFLCNMFGHSDPATCPITPKVIFAVNVGEVYIISLLSGVFGISQPQIAILAMGIVPVNALTHIINPWITDIPYNPGLVTAFLLFIPFSLQGYVAFRATKAEVAFSLLFGFLGHVVVFGSFKALMAGAMTEQVFIAIQLVVGFYPLLAPLVMKPRGQPRQKAE